MKPYVKITVSINVGNLVNVLKRAGFKVTHSMARKFLKDPEFIDLLEHDLTYCWQMTAMDSEDGTADLYRDYVRKHKGN